MSLTENKILQLIQIQLFHINLPFPSTLRMIEFPTILTLTLNTSPSLALLTNETFLFESFLIDVFNSFYVDDTIFLLEVTLRNPYCTYVVNPNEMASWLFLRICSFGKIIIIRLIFPRLWKRSSVFLLVFVIWTLFSILIVLRVRVLEQRGTYVDVCSFHCTALYVAQGAWEVYSCWAEWCAYLADPVICWDFGQTNTTLVQTDIAHGAENNEIIISVVSIGADLTFCIFCLTLPLFLFD